jgi:hypothetical protein
MTAADDRFQDWLHSKPGLDFLSICARRALRQLPEGMYELKYSPDALQDVIHDLWLFMTELSPDKRQDLFFLAEQGEGSKLVSILIKLFVRSCLDKRRTSTHSPWHALYRRIRSLLSQTQGIVYQSESTQAWYAWTDRHVAGKEPLQEHDFNSWPPPFVNARELTASDNLLYAARFFWDLTREKTSQASLISVRSLTNYLGAHFPGQLRTPVVYADDPNRPDVGENDVGQTPDAASLKNAPEHMITAQKLPELAADFAAGLSPLERDLWLLRFEQELGLQAIARELGLRGASGVHYHYAKVEKRFQNICLLWPGLSPEDQNRELAIHFLEATLSACKEQDQSRDE